MYVVSKQSLWWMPFSPILDIKRNADDVETQLLRSLFCKLQNIFWIINHTTRDRSMKSNLAVQQAFPFQFGESFHSDASLEGLHTLLKDYHLGFLWRVVWIRSHCVRFCDRHSVSSRDIHNLTYRKAFGFRLAMCWIFRVSWPWRSCNRLKASSSRGYQWSIRWPFSLESAFDSHHYLPIKSFDCGMLGLFRVRRAMTDVVLNSLWPWNSVRKSKYRPIFESGS